jgi:RNA recognition motif-containing protein
VKIDNIESTQKFYEACDKLKYFEIDGKPCRALPYDRDILGQNRQKINDRNVFVKKIPLDMKAIDLDKSFSQFGRVKSAKISLDKDHKSNLYGFVAFEDIESTVKAIEATKDLEFSIASKYVTKDKKELQKIFNNIYVKNFPATISEIELK